MLFAPHIRLCSLSLALTIAGCGPLLMGPENPNSSLIIGRIVVNNQFHDDYAVLPLGAIEKGIQVLIESRDGKQINTTTESGGYFFIPNVPANTYRINSITFEGSRRSGSGEFKSRRRQGLQRLSFTPIPGKVAYIGNLVVGISETGSATVNETRDDEAARSYFKQEYRESPWVLREFVSVGPGSTVATQLAEPKPQMQGQPLQENQTGPKADRPEWKPGYQWRYAWKRPRESGTATWEVVREETFEGVPSYVVRLGKGENYYTKENLGLLATMVGGRITLRRNPPYRPIVWPLEIGKEWQSSFTLERINQKSSQSYNQRFVVSKIEDVIVPAGTFETFKIEGYDTFTRNLINEVWYSSKVKWFVKERSYINDGVLERELVSFNVD